jgi:hypothetical protein
VDLHLEPGKTSSATEDASQQVTFPACPGWVPGYSFELSRDLINAVAGSRSAPHVRRVPVPCTDTKNPALFDNARVSKVCATKTAYFCG